MISTYGWWALIMQMYFSVQNDKYYWIICTDSYAYQNVMHLLVISTYKFNVKYLIILSTW